MNQVGEHILGIISGGTFDGPVYRLPEGVLPRPVYVEVNKVLEAMGGKWNRGRKGHVFDGDADDALESVILTGQFANLKQDLGQFDTPEEVADYVVIEAGISAGMTVLEPSCGIGNLALAAKKRGAVVTGIELDPKRQAKAAERVAMADCYCLDFLKVNGSSGLLNHFDVALMNPPFGKRVDLDHVEHARRFVRPGGQVVSIMSAGVVFRRDRRSVAFRELVRSNMGTIVELPKGSFKVSGTSVNTVLVTMDVP